MRHRLKWLSTYGLNGHKKGDEHPAYGPIWGMALYKYLASIDYYWLIAWTIDWRLYVC